MKAIIKEEFENFIDTRNTGSRNSEVPEFLNFDVKAQQGRNSPEFLSIDNR